MKLNNYKILSIILFVCLFATSTILFSTQKKETNTQDEWKNLVDSVNNWEIKYPPEIDEILLTQDMGPQDDVLNNILFSTNENSGSWVFYFAVSKTKFKDIESIVSRSASDPRYSLDFEKYIEVNGLKISQSIDRDNTGNKYFSFIKNEKLFSLQVKKGVDYQKILEGFKYGHY